MGLSAESTGGLFTEPSGAAWNPSPFSPAPATSSTRPCLVPPGPSPDAHQPSPSPRRPQFTCLVAITTTVSTFLSFLRPTVNAYALNSIAVHVLYIVFQEYKKWVPPAGAGMGAPYTAGPPRSSGTGAWLTPCSRPPADEARGQAANLRLSDSRACPFLLETPPTYTRAENVVP